MLPNRPPQNTTKLTNDNKCIEPNVTVHFENSHANTLPGDMNACRRTWRTFDCVNTKCGSLRCLLVRHEANVVVASIIYTAGGKIRIPMKSTAKLLERYDMKVQVNRRWICLPFWFLILNRSLSAHGLRSWNYLSTDSIQLKLLTRHRYYNYSVSRCTNIHRILSKQLSSKFSNRWSSNGH